MPPDPTKWKKLLGSGPLGMSLSLLLLLAAWLLKDRLDLPEISDDQAVLNLAFGVSAVLAAGVILWSHIVLPPSARGNRLCTSGPFRYVRHPLYAAFISIFNFGLALYLDNCIYLVWVVLVHAVWHWAIRYEERQMTATFGEEYRAYQRRTGRFLPRLWGCRCGECD